MDNAEAGELLAREVLQEALRLWAEESKDSEIIEMPDGDLAIPLEVGNRCLGFGYIYSHFLPISAARLIVRDCETYFNNLSVRFQNEAGEIQVTTLGERQFDKGMRKAHIKGMAVQAVRCLLLNLESRIKDALLENFEDSLMQTQAALHNNVAEIFNVTSDIGSDIKERARESAKRRESRLRRFIEQPQLNNIQAIINKGGRPKKADGIEAVLNILRKHGKDVGKARVALDLKVDERTITNYMQDADFDAWSDVVEAASPTQDKEM